MGLRYETVTVTSFRQNATILWDEESREAVLIDVGGDIEHIQAVVDDHQLNVTAIWLTHGHVDHVGGVVAYVEKRPVPIIGPHQDDDFWLQQLPTITAAYEFPMSPAFFPTQWLIEGDVLKLGHHHFSVWHIPGHSPGHVVFYNVEHHLLIAGDVLFYESIGRTDFPRSNNADLLRNIKEKLLILPDETIVLPGHGHVTSIGHEKIHNPFL